MEFAQNKGHIWRSIVKKPHINFLFGHFFNPKFFLNSQARTFSCLPIFKGGQLPSSWHSAVVIIASGCCSHDGDLFNDDDDKHRPHSQIMCQVACVQQTKMLQNFLTRERVGLSWNVVSDQQNGSCTCTSCHQGHIAQQ